MRFKVGDKVKIARKYIPGKVPGLLFDLPTSIGVILSIDYNSCRVAFDEHCVAFYYKPSMLRLYERLRTS